MINLRIHTEFHFDFSDRGYGKLAAVVGRLKAMGQTAGVITDATTFGHIGWFRECTKAGLHPLLGAEIRVPIEEGANGKITLIARNDDGLRELYNLTSLTASEQVSLDDVLKSSLNVIKLTGTSGVSACEVPKRLRKSWYHDISPSTPPELRTERGLPMVATSDNRYPCIEDRAAFSLFGGSKENHPQHLLSEREARALIKGLPASAFTLSDEIAKTCKVTIPSAQNMKVKGDLEKICRDNIRARLGRWTKRYDDRLKLELKMIKEKKFEDYFLIISDMVRYAKRNMVVGPARGSAAGSLVCFLADITDVDPIQHGLLFERFIDVTRADLPDIDLDFPDNKRELVITYLRERYGDDNVAHIGNVLTFQPKSIIRHLSRKLDVHIREFQPLLDSMIERSSGDTRGELCLLDTLEGIEAGKTIMTRFPQVRTATAFEGHANTAGTHAAGIIVCANPVKDYCTVNAKNFTSQIDKVDAERLNLLKIDILGLRTLSVLEYVLSIIPKRIDLTKIPLEDAAAFRLINEGKWAGIFQFEGDAVQMLSKQITVDQFSDVVALSALARPGPLNSGGATNWANRRMGREETTHLHPLIEEFTQETYGIIVYQEQVMSISRKVGMLAWEDVTEIRKTMAKSKGEEHFNQYWVKFLAGALKQGIKKEVAEKIWGHLSTMGAWAFNKSHAVSYGLISYWCAYLKVHFPKEFAAATLRHTKGEEQTVNLLRELQEEGINYASFDIKTSRENWEVINGTLTGGFINLKGIGETGAEELVRTRGKWTDKQKERVAKAEVLYSNVFPTKTRYGQMYDNPKGCGFPGVKRFWTARELDAAKNADELPDEFYFIGRLADKVPRDLNEYIFQVKRVQEGRPKLLTHETAYLNLVAEDDTGRVYCGVNNRMYEDVGRPIVNEGIVGKSWYVFRGRLNKIRRINITWAKDITEEEHA